MKSFLVTLVLATTIAGCRAAVPYSFANHMEKHNENVQELYGVLNSYLEAEIAIVESKLASTNDKDALLLLHSHLYGHLLLAKQDAKLSRYLERWADYHKWNLAISAND